MRQGWISLLVVVSVTLTSGCAYFNGLYNANRLVEAAARAEREGRIGEARSLWSQVAVKAESVAVRYPNSKYRDDALLLQGQAMSAVDRCQDAVEPLRMALDISTDSVLRLRSFFVLGRCLYLLGETEEAIESLNQAVGSTDTVMESAALLWRGRALAAQGAYEAAAVDLDASELSDAKFDLAIVYARLDRPIDAGAVLRSLVRRPYVEARWIAVLDTVGGELPEVAADAVDLLSQREDLEHGSVGRMLLQDGDRWAELGDTTRAVRRYDEVLRVAPDSAVGNVARLRWIVAGLRAATELARLLELSDSLEALRDRGGPEVRSATELADLLVVVAASFSDSDDGGASAEWRRRHPDLEMFVNAEVLRDRIDAHGLAVALFSLIAERFPRSPVAPKALLAAAQLDRSNADSLLTWVYGEYPTSPYTLVLAGSGSAEYAALEDSLRTLLAMRGYN